MDKYTILIITFLREVNLDLVHFDMTFQLQNQDVQLALGMEKDMILQTKVRLL